MKDVNDHLLETMKAYPPYTINSLISGLCACFSAYLGIERYPKELITSEFLCYAVLAEISKKQYPSQLAKAFETLCNFISNDNLLRELCHTIKDSAFSSDLKDLFETLVTGELLRLLKSEMGTPPQLNKLCIKLLNPINGTFYDGVAGIGSTAIDAFLFTQDKGGKLDICTQEINSLGHAVSVLRAFLHKIKSHSMYCGDTLTEPMTIKCGSLQTFDFSIMFPPFGLSWKNDVHQIYRDIYNRFAFGFPPTSSADWLFVQHQYASLRENGKGIIALPSGALFNAATSRIRKEVICAGIVECIITLPPGMVPYTGIPISLMVISKTKKADAQVLMIQAEGLFKDTPSARLKDASILDGFNINSICEIYRERTQISGASTLVDISTLEKNDWVLLPSRYTGSGIIETEYGRLMIDYPIGDNWLPLRRVGSFYRGINVAPHSVADEEGPFKIINLADVKNGEINPGHLARYRLTGGANIQKYEALPGDVLVSCKGVAIKICVVPPHAENILLSINFIGIRVNRSIFNPLFIKYYLESPAGQVLLQAKQVGTSITTLSTRDLEEIPLPHLSLEKQNQYVQKLVDIEHQIHSEMERLYTQSKEAKWKFYQEIGLGEIMKGDIIDGN